MTTTLTNPRPVTTPEAVRAARIQCDRVAAASVTRWGRFRSAVARQLRALSVAEQTPSEQAMSGLSSVDRPLR